MTDQIIARVRPFRYDGPFSDEGEHETESMEVFSGGTPQSRARRAYAWFDGFDIDRQDLDKWTANGVAFWDANVGGRR